MKTNSTETQSPRTSTARTRIWYQNNHYGAEGTLFIDNDHENHIHIYGFKDLRIWNPMTKEWTNLPDKFYVTQDDPELAQSEFFFRWKKYIQTRFHTNFIRIEIKSIERN